MIEKNEYNVYCDESCHLEKDQMPVMLIGAVWCPVSARRKITEELKKLKHSYRAEGELKWTKASKARISYYTELIKYFFKTPELHFRCLVVKNKEKLDHISFNQGSHDAFYYKMYFSMLKAILSPENRYNIYLDIKDTRSKQKIQRLREVLCTNVYDFTGQMIANIQHVHSHESEILQLADFLIGAVAYRNRMLTSSVAKQHFVSEIEKGSCQNLISSTSLFNNKFNLFIFSPQQIQK